VWESVEALKAYVYGSRHREYVRRRKVWFEHFGRPYYALWWVPRGNIPRVAEAIRRLETMQREGDSTEAFSFGRPFPPPSPEGGAADALRGAPSAGLGMLPFGYPRGVPDPPPHPHPRRTHMARYALSTTVPGTFDDVKERVVGALKEQGFGILTEIDMQATLKKKLDVDMERYEILGACNPPLAHRAVGADRNIGLLLPCNVILREAGEGRIEVGMLDPVSMFSLVDEDVADSMQDLPAEARRRLQAALEAVGSSTPA
jgi:uncharacterized protein (DUF302 family)